MHKLVDYICDELEELERKADKDGKLSMAEVQYMDLLAHTKKNLLKGEEMMGSSYYDGGSSYRMGGSSRAGEESGQSRARGRGRNARRDSRGRYSSEGSSRRAGSSYYEGSSYADSVDDMVESIYKIMDELPENTKHEAQKFVQKLEQSM